MKPLRPILLGSLVALSAPSFEGDAQAQEADRLSRGEMLARINRLSKPTEDHRFLQPLVGDWRGEGRVRLRPGEAFRTVRCRMQSEWILGGRFLSQRLKCVVDGDKVEGRGFIGFDRIAHRYVGVWMDTSDTGYTSISGKRTSAVSFVLSMRHNNAVTRKKDVSTTTITINNDRRHSYVSTTRDPESGADIVLLEMVYTR